MQFTTSEGLAGARRCPRAVSIAAPSLAAVGVCLLLAAAPASAGEYCSATARAQYDACKAELKDDLSTARAICINVSDAAERSECVEESAEAFDEGGELCLEQRDARLDLCDALGEDRYDPDFDPSDFDDDFTSPNPYFPLAVGNRWSFAGGVETIEVEVLDQTKAIEGVTCVVVRDVVREDGQLVEDTDDWFGQRRDGTVDYCGELSRNYERFEGDDPDEPELVDIEGSWKAGGDGDKPGTLFPGAPQKGAVYRQEWSAGNAEDAAVVLSTSYRYGRDAKLDAHVPRGLAQLVCSSARPCVVTGEFSPLDPETFERKYYARGIGLFLEVHPDSGEIVQLVDCNVDSRCASLPQP
jgi:hypothetical protein